MKILIPMAGEGSRFASAGYTFPKPLIEINQKTELFNNKEPIIEFYKIVLINSDYDIGYEIKRSELHQILVNEYDIYSSYEPCIYPGVNIKYYYNKDTEGSSNAGICKCNDNCNGKGCGHGDGLCKKITIVVFMSGQIMITGARNRDHILICYNFITKMLNSKKELLILQ